MALLVQKLWNRGVLVALTFLSFSVACAGAFGQESTPALNRPDTAIESDVVAAITASPVLNVQPIVASTVAGVVTLSGSVDDAASKELAQIVVSKVAGVASVVNSLSIVPIGAPVLNAPPSSSDPGQDSQQQAPQQAEQPPAGEQQGAPEAAYPSPSSSSPSSSSRPPYEAAPAARGQYPSSQPNQYGPVQIPQGTLLTVRLNEPLDSRRISQGAIFEVTSARDIFVGGALAVPRGATLEGQVVDIRSVKGSLSGSASLSLKLSALVLEGRSYPLESDVWVGNGPGKGGYSAGNTIAGAGIGAVIGGLAGGGAGAAIGATLGGATGATASSASSGPQVVLPPETVLTFHLTTPITVVPVAYKEAQRLASSQPQRRPSLERRPGYPRPPVVYGYPYGYPYPYPYAYGYPRYRGYYGPGGWARW